VSRRLYKGSDGVAGKASVAGKALAHTSVVVALASATALVRVVVGELVVGGVIDVIGVHGGHSGGAGDQLKTR